MSSDCDSLVISMLDCWSSG